MADRPRPHDLVRRLPAHVPFISPELLARRTGRAIELRVGANESPYGPSPRAVEAMRESLARVGCYGDPASHELRSALAALHCIGPDHIVVGAGIDDVLALAVRTFLGPGEPAVGTAGTYPMLPFLVAGQGGRLETVAYRDRRCDPEALAGRAHDVGARLVYLANPDNPSGSQLRAADLAGLLDELPARCLLLLDEAYAELGDLPELLPWNPDDPRLLRLRTFSKAYGMAGARIGYVVGAREHLAELEKLRLHFNVNAVAQAGALAALADRAYLDEIRVRVDRARRHYAEIGAAAGLPTYPSRTNFVCFETGSRDRAAALRDRLLDRGVFTRLPWGPPLDSCVRISVAVREGRERLAEILAALV